MALLILVYYTAVQVTGESAEYRSFKDHFADLFKSVGDPTSLAAELYAIGILSLDTRNKIFSKGVFVDSDKVCLLLVATETTIRLDPSNYHKFVETLENLDCSMQHLCGKLRSTCGECDNVCLSTSTDQCMVF